MAAMKSYPLLLFALCLSTETSAWEINFTVTCDRGEDMGQCFGSLFEAEADNGSLVIGAGFQNAYNTRYRADRHEVQLFIRPKHGSREMLITQLPRPTETLTGAYLYSRDGVVYSTYGGMKAWNEESQSWRSVSTRDGGAVETMRVGDGILRFGDSAAFYDDETILDPPAIGRYELFFYAHGQLCFYHVHKGSGPYRPWKSDTDGFSKLYACSWKPGDGAIDVARATTLRTPVVGEMTFAWGQLGRQIVTGSNIGGFYVLEDNAWRMILKPNVKQSFQLYCSVEFRDRLLMGQYPTGRMFQYNGDRLTERLASPPVLNGVSSVAREAQTTAIYGGELFVGVWPWGELWRYSPDRRAWTFVRRMFDHPKLSDAIVHPYDVENRAHTPGNLWGQRITSLVPNGRDLLVATSAKSPFPWDSKAFPFLAPKTWRSYGRVHKLTMSGHLGAPTKWTDRPTTFQFTINADAVVIRQDGKTLASTRLAESIVTRLGRVETLESVQWGNGIYGRFSGDALTGQANIARRDRVTNPCCPSPIP